MYFLYYHHQYVMGNLAMVNCDLNVIFFFNQPYLLLRWSQQSVNSNIQLNLSLCCAYVWASSTLPIAVQTANVSRVLFSIFNFGSGLFMLNLTCYWVKVSRVVFLTRFWIGHLAKHGWVYQSYPFFCWKISLVLFLFLYLMWIFVKVFCSDCLIQP